MTDPADALAATEAFLASLDDDPVVPESLRRDTDRARQAALRRDAQRATTGATADALAGNTGPLEQVVAATERPRPTVASRPAVNPMSPVPYDRQLARSERAERRRQAADDREATRHLSPSADEIAVRESPGRRTSRATPGERGTDMPSTTATAPVARPRRLKVGDAHIQAVRWTEGDQPGQAYFADAEYEVTTADGTVQPIPLLWDRSTHTWTVDGIEFPKLGDAVAALVTRRAPTPTETATLADLRAQAARYGVKGRSRMNRDQLLAALTQAPSAN
jgi:hypothetical protein